MSEKAYEKPEVTVVDGGSIALNGEFSAAVAPVAIPPVAALITKIILAKWGC